MDPTSRVEQFNNLVRGLVTLGLTAGFIWGFLFGKVIDSGVYGQMFGIIVTFWFAQRQAERSFLMAAQQTKANGAPTQPQPPAGDGGHP